MFLAIAALLIQPQFVPQLSVSAEKIALIQPVIASAPSSTTANGVSLPPAPAGTEASVQPEAVSNSAALPDAPVPAPALHAAAWMPFIRAGKPMTVSVGELVAENRRKQLLWKGLVIASSGAATFDAWSTRHAITTAGAQELNPMLRPFAGNASLYAAIQVGPALMDYAGKKMMYNSHSWVRRLWWVPQSASFVSSMFCGAHNLSFQ